MSGSTRSSRGKAGTAAKKPRGAEAARTPLVPLASHRSGWIEIDSFAALCEREKEIVQRIMSTVNGGNLFMAHPFQLLADIGVTLSERATKEILEREPHLSALSRLPYDALKRTVQHQRVTIRLRGLFRRDAR